LCDGTPNSATYQILISSIIDSYEITCRKSHKTGGFYPAAFVPLGMANTISRFSFQDSVDADAFHHGGRGASIMIALLLVFVIDQADVDTKD
jgi:hypothetical protein